MKKLFPLIATVIAVIAGRAAAEMHIIVADHETKRVIKIKEDGTLLWDARNDNGHDVQLLPNGNLLTVEPLGGRALEVTRDPEPKLVWDYVNVIGSENGQRLRGLVQHAQRFAEGELTFLGQP